MAKINEMLREQLIPVSEELSPVNTNPETELKVITLK